MDVVTQMVLLASVVAGFWAFSGQDPDRVVVESFSVPQVLADRGYGGAVMSNRIAMGVHDIVLEARNGSNYGDVMARAHPRAIDAVGESFVPRSLYEAFKEVVGLLEGRLEGDVATGDDGRLTLRLTYWNSERGLLLKGEATAEDPERLIAAGTRAAARLIDPMAYATTQFNDALEEAKRAGKPVDFTPVLAAIEDCFILLPPEKYKSPYVLWGAVLILQGRFAEADEKLAAASRLSPDDEMPILVSAYGLAARGDHAAALDRVREVQARHPKSAAVYAVWGELLYDRGDLPGALTMLEIAASLRPDMEEVQAGLGRILLEEGRTEAAIQRLGRALSIMPEDPAVTALMRRALNIRDDQPAPAPVPAM